MAPEVLHSDQDLNLTGTITNGTAQTITGADLVTRVQRSTEATSRGLSTWLTLVPRPKTLPVGGVDLIDGPMLEWCSKFINSIYSADPKALEES